ncbi:MAG: FAD-dependent oxidoreductase [Xanthomonadales bacterium]|nr:FAD-dependent oxidoreductase [Xanthomonadales bacterium]
MRIAVVGSGIAGLASAWLLSRRHEVVLYEAEDRLGGHTHTHDVRLGNRRYRVDTGFIVMNPQHYPLLSALFAELGVATQPTTMSFSVRNERSGLEYNASTLQGLFCQRRNLVSPRFLGMVRDILRFYRQAGGLLAQPGPGPSLASYLTDQGYGDAFRDDHLVPMAAALWSSPSDAVLGFPARFLVQFMANHQMLQVSGRPEWRTVAGGSGAYIDALRARWQVQVRLADPVRSVERLPQAGVRVRSVNGEDRFDQVVLACHSDQSLALLAQPSPLEAELLGAIGFQANDTVLHTDASVLPRRGRAWAAWNALVPAEAGERCTVSYLMNQLQSLDAPTPLVVSLNQTDRIDADRILARMTYHHPLYTEAAVAAQGRRAEIDGVDRVWYAGAWWGWGFHEDGIRSAVDIARALDVDWPAAASAGDAQDR